MRSLVALACLLPCACVGAAEPYQGPSYQPSQQPSPCGGPPTRMQPFVVDWAAAARADLSAAMQRQLVVMHYDCGGFYMLLQCQLPGAYTYTGFTPKQETRVLRSSVELGVNLPLSASNPASQVPLQVSRGNSVEISVRMVGNFGTDRMGARFAELVGSCQGATHFVRQVTVGASDLRLGGSSTVADGDPNACSGANPNSGAPTPGCASPLQLDLVPLQ
jgi:uncharacterized protein